MRHKLGFVLFVFCALVVALAAHSQASKTSEGGGTEAYDLLIVNGRIIDGSGNAWYGGEIGIRKGHIASIGRLGSAHAPRVIDAQGHVVAPGFVDAHMHVESTLAERPTADNLVTDGITSIVTGNCGGSKLHLREWFAALEEGGIGVNLASLIGHNTVRREVMGRENRGPTAEELVRMEALVAAAMEEGAVGFSTGLEYVPGTYAATEELVALARVAARYGGLYATHMRNEGKDVLNSVEESLRVAREAQLPLQISHFKVSNQRFWGASRQMLALLEKARVEGIDATADQYPYTASSTRLDILLPSWALAGGQAELNRRLADRAERGKIAKEMRREIQETLGYDHVDYAVVARAPSDPSLEGKSIREINRTWTTAEGHSAGRADRLKDEIETVLDIMERGGAQMVYHKMGEEDVIRILRHPLVMLGRDGGVPPLGDGKPHPRNYGSAARILGRYVRERKVLRSEEAIRKLTSLAAQRFGFHNRGVLREGLWADIVIFDPETVSDRATYDDPHHFSHGINYVLVNGELVVDGGRLAGARPGKILYGPGFRPGAATNARRPSR